MSRLVLAASLVVLLALGAAWWWQGDEDAVSAPELAPRGPATPASEADTPVDDAASPGRAEPAALFTERPGTLFVDADGRPVPGVVVLRLREAPPAPRSSETWWPLGVSSPGDRSGHAQLPADTPLLVVAPDHGPLLLPAAAQPPARVELPTARVLELLFLDSVGEPVREPPWRVELRADRWPFETPGRRVSTVLRDAQALRGELLARTVDAGAWLVGKPQGGRLVLHGLAADVALDLTVIDDWGFPWLERRLHARPRGSARETLVVRAPPSLGVLVCDADGEPMRGTVTVVEGGLPRGPRDIDSVATGLDGFASIPVAEPGWLSIEVSAPGYVTFGFIADAPGDVQVILEPAHVLDVSWVDDLHGDPVEPDHVEVSWRESPGAWREGARVTRGLGRDEGRWLVGGLPWRDVRIRARLGGEWLEAWHHPRDGGYVGTVACRGAVVVSWPDRRGAFSATTWRRLPEGDREFHRQHPVGGSERFDTLEPGRWEVSSVLYAPEHFEFEPVVVDVTAHETVDVELRAPRPDDDADG